MRLLFLLNIICFIYSFNVYGQVEANLFPHIKGTDRLDSISEYAWEIRYDENSRSQELLEYVIEQSKDLGYNLGEGMAWNRLGVVYLDREDYLKSEESFFKSLSFLEGTKHINRLASCYNNLGTLFYHTFQSAKAKEYFEKAFQLYDDLNKTDNIINVAINLGLVAEYDARWDDAYGYYNTALKLADAHADPEQYANILINFGSYYVNVNQHHKADESFRKALMVFQNNNDSLGVADCYYNWGVMMEINRLPEKAIFYYNKALELSRLMKQVSLEADCYEGLLLSYSLKGEYDSVEHYYLMQRELDYDVNRKIFDKDLIELETQYEVEKKERQLELEQERGEKMQLANKANKRTIWLMGGGILLAVIVLIGGIVFYMQRQRISKLTIAQRDQEINKMIAQQETMAYESQIEGERQERRRIAAELHDRVGGLLATINLHTEDGQEESPVRNLVKMTIEEVRNISHNLSESLHSGELKHTLEKLKKAVDTSGKLSFDLYYELDQVVLPSGMSKEVYKVVQELTTNTLKHANAQQITLQLTRIDNSLNLIFEDDGDGYDQNEITPGLGISNIEERINKIRGSIQVDSRKGRGTSTIIEIPLS